jgi:polyhydroxyalkanoate synthesis regulator phasin
VADAIVHMIRASAGLEGFRLDQAQELVQYSVRRGLISADEGDELMQDVSASAKGRRAAANARKAKKAAKKKSAKKSAKKVAKKKPAIAKKKPAKKKPAKKRPSGKKPVKKVKKR